MKIALLIAIALATPAAAQNLGVQTSAETASPTTAWTGGFAPDMQTTVARKTTDTNPECRPAVTTSDGREFKAGASLVPVTVCVKAPLAPEAPKSTEDEKPAPAPAKAP